MELFLLSLFYLIFSGVFEKIKILFVFFLLLIFVVVVFPDWIEMAINIISSRQEVQSGFNMQDTNRLSMIIYPINVLFRDGLFSVFLGNGLSSFKYLFNSDEDCLYVTSNNIFADLLYEGGLLSIVCLILLFVCFWKQIRKVERQNLFDTIIYIKLFLVHIVLSSFYRADYASGRYIVLFLIIGLMYNIKNVNVNCNYPNV